MLNTFKMSHVYFITCYSMTPRCENRPRWVQKLIHGHPVIKRQNQGFNSRILTSSKAPTLTIHGLSPNAIFLWAEGISGRLMPALNWMSYYETRQENKKHILRKSREVFHTKNCLFLLSRKSPENHTFERFNKDGYEILVFPRWNCQFKHQKETEIKIPFQILSPLEMLKDGQVVVFVFKGCHNKVQHTGWLSTEMYSLQIILVSRRLKSRFQQGTTPWRLWVESFLASSQLLVGALSPCVLM